LLTVSKSGEVRGAKEEKGKSLLSLMTSCELAEAPGEQRVAVAAASACFEGRGGAKERERAEENKLSEKRVDGATATLYREHSAPPAVTKAVLRSLEARIRSIEAREGQLFLLDFRFSLSRSLCLAALAQNTRLPLHTAQNDPQHLRRHLQPLASLPAHHLLLDPHLPEMVHIFSYRGANAFIAVGLY
jgi:hypothetical protein